MIYKSCICTFISLFQYQNSHENSNKKIQSYELQKANFEGTLLGQYPGGSHWCDSKSLCKAMFPVSTRSPSPEPIYNNEGKRLNTREYRTRKKLEEDRHRLVQEAMGLNTDYKPPADYK